MLFNGSGSYAPRCASSKAKNQQETIVVLGRTSGPLAIAKVSGGFSPAFLRIHTRLDLSEVSGPAFLTETS